MLLRSLLNFHSLIYIYLCGLKEDCYITANMVTNAVFSWTSLEFEKQHTYVEGSMHFLQCMVCFTKYVAISDPAMLVNVPFFLASHWSNNKSHLEF